MENDEWIEGWIREIILEKMEFHFIKLNDIMKFFCLI